MIAILAAVNENECKNKDILNELLFQGALTIKNRKKFHGDKKVKDIIFCFNPINKKKSLSNMKDDLIHKDSILYIVGHHENFGKIGTMNSIGFTPEQLADMLYLELEQNIALIKQICFFACNTAYHPENINDSYCGKFLKYMKDKYKNKNLIVAGFIGFLFEDPIKKRTYLSKEYNDKSKIIRADDNIIYFHNT
jgi:hypothetical protein